MQDKQVLVFQETGFQPPVPYQCWEMVENENTLFVSYNKIQNSKG